MTEKEVQEMQYRIDEGIRLAQQRLWQRAGHSRQSLVVCKDGKIQEVIPQHVEEESSEGDPLSRRKP